MRIQAPARPRLSLALIAASACLSLAACGGGGSTDDTEMDQSQSASATAQAVAKSAGVAIVGKLGAPQSNSPYVIHNVNPSVINSSVIPDSPSDFHVVIPPVAGVTPVNKLFVFLPGTDGVPNMYELILKAGASRGYHTIGLAYPNPTPIGVICSTSTDPNCFWDTRVAVIDGGTTADISVSTANAIVTRLTQAVAYLNATYPTEGWGRYLSNGALDWSKIVVGGHSQGGGHAGVMAKLFAMNRACYFASPPDWDLHTNAPASWESKTNVTPVSAQYGFGGLQDPSVPWTQLQPIWRTIGLAGPVTQVDTASAPYGDSHMLTTNAQPNTSTGDPGTPLHGLTVRDAFTPIGANGVPVFDPVWGYMCFQ